MFSTTFARFADHSFSFWKRRVFCVCFFFSIHSVIQTSFVMKLFFGCELALTVDVYIQSAGGVEFNWR